MKPVIIAWVVLLCAVFSGCASRDEKLQSAANAVKGTKALGTLAEATDPQLASNLTRGIESNVLASVAAKLEDLPAAEMTVDEILADSGTYQTDAEQRHKDSLSWGVWSWIGGALLAAGGIAMRIVPGAHKPLLGMFLKLFENKTDKKTREREESLAQGSRYLMDAIELYGPKQVKEWVARKTPPKVDEAIKEYLEEMRARGVKPAEGVSVTTTRASEGA